MKKGEEYSTIEWVCIKMSLVYIFFRISDYILSDFHSLPYPIGILSWLPAGYSYSHTIESCLKYVAYGAALLYIFERGMIVATLVLFLYGTIVFSIGESNGVLGRNGLLSIVFLAQFFAYLFDRYHINFELKKSRVQFSLQAIAAVYTLAAISKITSSGISWLSDSQYLSLQVLKSFDFNYVTNGDMNQHIKGIHMSSWVLGHPYVVKTLLLSSLLLESFSFVIFINKRLAFIYGIFLIGMHLGIYITMDIFFESISYPMIIFCINPLYCAVLVFEYIKNRYFTKPEYL